MVRDDVGDSVIKFEIIETDRARERKKHLFHIKFYRIARTNIITYTQTK